MAQLVASVYAPPKDAQHSEGEKTEIDTHHGSDDPVVDAATAREADHVVGETKAKAKEYGNLKTKTSEG